MSADPQDVTDQVADDDGTNAYQQVQTYQDAQPDPALGEGPDGGEAGVAQTNSVSRAKSRELSTQRYREADTYVKDLQNQAGQTQGQISDAYAAQRKALEDATQRILQMQGPSESEQLARQSAAISSGGTANMAGNVGAANAQFMLEKRQAENAKNELLVKYGTQIPGLQMQQGNARMQQIAQQMRYAISAQNNAANNLAKNTDNLSNMPFGVTNNGDGTYTIPPGNEALLKTLQTNKLYGRLVITPNADGSKTVTPGGAYAPALESAINRAAGSPAASGAPGSAALHRSMTTVAKPGQPAQSGQPAQPGQPSNIYSALVTPSTVLDPKYSTLNSASQPKYAAAAQQAFAPDNFSNFVFDAKNDFAGMPVQKEMAKSQATELGNKAAASQQILFNYGHALRIMDTSPAMRSGPVGAKINAAENSLRGLVPDDVLESMFHDPALKKLSTEEQLNKYFKQASSVGLKAIYGGRISNMEVKQRADSLPNTGLIPAVARMLAAAQADVAQHDVMKNSLFGQYMHQGGRALDFETWYNHTMNPYSDSLLNKSLHNATPSKGWGKATVVSQ